MKKIIYLGILLSSFGCNHKIEQRSPLKTTFSEFETMCKGAYTTKSFCSVATKGISNILDWNDELNCTSDHFKTIGWIKYSELSKSDKQLVAHFCQWDNSENIDCNIELELQNVLIGGCYTEALSPDGWSISKGIVILYVYDKNNSVLYRIVNNDYF